MNPRSKWSDQEVDLLRYLASCGLSPTKIADVYAIVGWQIRESREVQSKGYKLGVEWKGDSSRG